MTAVDGIISGFLKCGCSYKLGVKVGEFLRFSFFTDACIYRIPFLIICILSSIEYENIFSFLKIRSGVRLVFSFFP